MHRFEGVKELRWEREAFYESPLVVVYLRVFAEKIFVQERDGWHEYIHPNPRKRGSVRLEVWRWKSRMVPCPRVEEEDDLRERKMWIRGWKEGEDYEEALKLVKEVYGEKWEEFWEQGKKLMD
jgi:hypothetical protein